MDQRVLDCIEEQKIKAADRLRKEKDELALELDLYEKEYAAQYSKEYPYSEWDAEEEKTVYYKKVPVQLTDEEYEALIKYHKSSKKKNKEVPENPAATRLKVFAFIICFVGIIVAFLAAHSSSVLSFVSILFTIFVYGAFFLGMAEIISLLNKINNK